MARSADRIEKEAAAIGKETGVNVRTQAADLSGAAAREQIAHAFPDVDILVNNAGAIPGGSIDQVDEPAWRAGWDLKVYGYIGLTRLYLKKMKERRSGVIINIIGAGGERLDFELYCGAAGNAGLMAFTAPSAAPAPQFGVPGARRQSGPGDDRPRRSARPKAGGGTLRRRECWRETFKKMPFGRPATCDEISASVVFLASDLCSYTSGTIVTIDGGIANGGGVP